MKQKTPHSLASALVKINQAFDKREQELISQINNLTQQLNEEREHIKITLEHERSEARQKEMDFTGTENSLRREFTKREQTLNDRLLQLQQNYQKILTEQNHLTADREKAQSDEINGLRTLLASERTEYEKGILDARRDADAKLQALIERESAIRTELERNFADERRDTAARLQALIERENELQNKLHILETEKHNAQLLVSSYYKDLRTYGEVKRELSGELARITKIIEKPGADKLPGFEDILAMKDTDFIDTAYKLLLGRPADPPGMEFYVERLRAGYSKKRILVQFATSKERKARISDLLNSKDNEEFIHAAFKFFLGRRADPGGLQNFKLRLNHGITKREVLKNIMDSDEAIAHNPILPELPGLIAENRKENSFIKGWFGRRAHYEKKITQLENKIDRAHLSSTAREELGQRLSRLGSLLASMPEPRALANLKDQPNESANKGVPDNENVHAAAAEKKPEFILSPVPDVEKTKNLKREIYFYVDHTITCPSNTGMQRVVRRLGDALLKKGEHVTFVKWDEEHKSLVLINRDELKYLEKWSGPKTVKSDRIRYPGVNDQCMPISPPSCDTGNWLVVPEVTHITNHREPMTLTIIAAGKRLGLKLAFIFYDATPLRRQELKSIADVHAAYMQQLMLVDLVIPISRWVAGDLTGYLKFDQKVKMGPSPVIHPIPLPGESHLAKRIKNPADKGNKAPFILSVGSIVPHKNQLALAQAFDRYTKDNPATKWQLMLVGNLHPDVSKSLMELTSSNKKINYLGDVPDDKLIRLYQECKFTVFPSILEGFGLPILESLWFGKPCICADFGAMAEAAEGGGCLTVDTSNIEKLGQAISDLIEDPDSLAALSKQACERKIDTWQDYATGFLDMLNQIDSPLAKVGNIYYWIDHTSSYPGNTGIQRVTRGLARALMEYGAKLIPVKWSEEKRIIIPATKSDIEHLQRWNGPEIHNWSPWIPLENITVSDWLIIPELTHYLAKTGPQDIRNFCRGIGLRCAWIFHDCIPWKMRSFYPEKVAEQHRDYMLALNDFEKVLTNSRYTRSDLLSFLSSENVRGTSMEDRIVACVLPGEFLGIKRVTGIKQRLNDDQIWILSVGTVEPRKNHLKLLQAIQKVISESSKSIKLTLLGSDPYPELAEQVQRMVDSTPGVEWIRKVDDEELERLYKNCDFTVYSSIEEGFGLPILESLWHAKPCICAEYGAMREVAEGGGCIMVDVKDVGNLGNAIKRLAEDNTLRRQLCDEAIAREFKSWKDYAKEILTHLAEERPQIFEVTRETSFTTPDHLYTQMINLEQRPRLSICISTYNRSSWLEINLKNLFRIIPKPLKDVEIFVCDNASTDTTPSVVSPYLDRSDFRYLRNSENVGMLGNLQVTANNARGEYIWILGDDDLLISKSVESVLNGIRKNPEVALVYLNYSYTREDKAENVKNLENFLANSTPIVPPSNNQLGTVRDICTKTENFFTAIYCLVFRRDHAIRAYSQNTSGRPFSSMLTCIPTTSYVLNYMMDEPALWLGTPQLVVNMNVSWMKYAPLWILERIPEVFDLAEKYGADPKQIDRWRLHHIPGVNHFYQQIFQEDPEGNAAYVSIQRLVIRNKHLQEFRDISKNLKDIYTEAHRKNHPLANLPPDVVFGF